MMTVGIRALRELATLTKALPNLRTLILSGVLGTLGAGLLNPVFPFYLNSRGLDLTRIGLVFTLGSLLPIFAQPILGVLSDHFSRRGFVIGVSLATSLLIPIFTLFDHPGPLAVILALKLILERSVAPVSAALVGDFAPKSQRATVFSLIDATTNLMFVVALVASAPAVKTFSTTGIFYLSGAFFLLSSLSLFRLEKSGPPRVPSDAHGPGSSGSTPQPVPVPSVVRTVRAVLKGLASPVVLLRRSPNFAGLFVYQFCFIFGLDLFPIYLPLYAVKLGASQAMVGPIIASSWLVYALVQPIGGRLADRNGRRKALILRGLAGMIACETLLGLAGLLPTAWALPGLLFGWILLAVPDGLFRPAAQALVIDVAPAEQRGEILGALGSATAIANVFAPLIYGAIAGRWGLESAFLISALAFGLAALGMLRVVEPSQQSPNPANPHPAGTAPQSAATGN